MARDGINGRDGINRRVSSQCCSRLLSTSPTGMYITCCWVGPLSVLGHTCRSDRVCCASVNMLCSSHLHCQLCSTQSPLPAMQYPVSTASYAVAISTASFFVHVGKFTCTYKEDLAVKIFPTYQKKLAVETGYEATICSTAV